MVHVPDGSGFLALSRLAVRVDDAQSSATASLPDAPIQSYRTEPRTRPLLAGKRPTNATPVVSLWHPYAQEAEDEVGGNDYAFGGAGGGGDRRLCTFGGNAAYETANAALERHLSPGGGYFTDVLFAGDCAGVKLRPNSRYWVVFENYYEIPRTSVFDADDFYYVAKARGGDEDPGGAAGWSIGDNPYWKWSTPGEADEKFRSEGSGRPLMFAVHAAEISVPDGDYGDWSLATPGGTTTRSATALATPDTGTAQYELTVACVNNALEAAIGVSSGTDTAWPPHAATLQLGVAGRSSALFDSDPDMDGDQPAAAVVDGQLVKFGSEELGGGMLYTFGGGVMSREFSGATITVTLLDSNDMEVGQRTLSVSLRGASKAIPAVQQACGGASSQLAAPVPDEAEADGPELQSATVNGSTLTLTFDEALDVGVALSGSAFTVTVDGAQRSVLVVGVGGADVLLTLASAVEAGDAVTVAYDEARGRQCDQGHRRQQGGQLRRAGGHQQHPVVAAAKIRNGGAARLADCGPPRDRQAQGDLEGACVGAGSDRLHRAVEGVR